MKTRTVIERIGERIGDIDWSYDFMSHAWTASRGGHNPELIPGEVERLRVIEDALREGKKVEVWRHSCPEEVVDIGMYDGWPYWRPVPSVCTRNWLGCSWHAFTEIGTVEVNGERATP